MAPPRVRSANARSNSRTERYRCPRHRSSSALFGSISSPRVNVAIASRNCRAPDWATPRSMIRAMSFGLASSAFRALLIASVSGSERYSTPAGDRYCSDCTPAWPAASAGTVINAAMMDMSLNGMGWILGRPMRLEEGVGAINRLLGAISQAELEGCASDGSLVTFFRVALHERQGTTMTTPTRLLIVSAV